MEKKGFQKLIHPITKLPKTFGQKAADALTKWAGSWTFILIFLAFIGIWIATNGIFLLKYFQGDMIDPYPFILLNLALSCLAAIQAPVILMSQNRTSQRDRLLAKYDFHINKKSMEEIEEMREQLNRIEKHINQKKK